MRVVCACVQLSLAGEDADVSPNAAALHELSGLQQSIRDARNTLQQLQVEVNEKVSAWYGWRVALGVRVVRGG